MYTKEVQSLRVVVQKSLLFITGIYGLFYATHGLLDFLGGYRIEKHTFFTGCCPNDSIFDIIVVFKILILYIYLFVSISIHVIYNNDIINVNIILLYLYIKYIFI